MNTQAQTVKDKTIAWLSNLNVTTPGKNIFLLQSTDLQVMNPANASATQAYIDSSSNEFKALAVTSDAPQTMYDGIQTIINLCRVKSGFNPLDPEGNGNKAHFIQFTQNISGVPCITLMNSQTKDIKQQSHNADELINSFVGAFDGLTQQDQDKIKKSVSDLAKAALSYSNEQESSSNFTQNVMQTGNDMVIFSLYASTFEISSSKHKGTITFQSEYTLHEAQYSLSRASWDNVKDAFSKQEKTSMEQWIQDMTTQDKAGSTVKALCLE